MDPTIHFFTARIRTSISLAPVELLCQAIDLEQEKFLWVDGLTLDYPVLIPIAAVDEIKYEGTFRTFMEKNIELAGRVFRSSDGSHSPTLLARAVQCMSRKPLTADEALHIVGEQAMDIIEVDMSDRSLFDQKSCEAV